jgi:hypothetical protein
MQKTTLVILFTFFNFFLLRANDKIKSNFQDVNFEVTVSLIGDVMVEYHDYNVLVTYDWQFEYGPVGFQPGKGKVVTISGIDFYRFKLDPLKKYELRVRERHLDGVNLVWGEWSQTKTIFATSDRVYSVGYTTNFDNVDDSKLEWRGAIYANSYAYVAISTGENHSVTNVNGASGEMSNRSYGVNEHVAFISPKFNDLATDRKISFWLYDHEEDEELLVGTMSDPLDLTTFHLLAEVPKEGNYGWNLKTVYFDKYNGTDQYVVFLLKGKYYGSNDSSINIDDFSYEQASNCYAQSNFVVTNLMENSAQISFVAPNQNNFQVSLTNVTKRITEVFNTQSSPFVLDNLVGNIDYEVKVRANCIDDHYSDWTTPIKFKTPCNVLVDGYSNSFEGANYFDLCWNTITSGASVKKDSEDENWYFEPLPKTGTKKIVMRTYGSQSTQKSYLITPYVGDLNATKRIRFSLLAYTTDNNYNTNSLTIGTMSDPNDASTFIALKTISPSEMNEIDNLNKLNLWKEHTVYLDNYQQSNQHHYIALKQNSEGSATFCIDDFYYESAPACLEPLNPKVIDFDYDFATVAWENYKPATEWQIEYGPKGFAHGSGISVNATASPFKIAESILDDTEYDFYIRAKCENGYSSWSDKGYFRTKCLGVTVGYKEDFENAVFEKNGCWTRIVPFINQRYWSKDRFIKVNIQQAGGTGASSGLRSMIMSNVLDAPYPEGTGGKTDRVILVSPRLKDFDHYKKINFWMVTPKETNNKPIEIIIGTLSDPEDYNTFTPYITIKIPLENIAKWLNYEVDFSNYYGTDKFIGFKQSVENDNYRRFVIDDFSYLKNDCPKPSTLGARQSGVDSVSLDWKDNNTNKLSESWDIEYGLKGFIEGSGAIVNSKTNPFNLTGLANGSYDYRVRTYCDTNITSEWSDRYTFKISCTNSAPYVENFDNYQNSLSEIPNFCWTNNIMIDAQLLEYSLTNINSAPNVFYLQANKDTAVLASPYLEDFDKNKKIKFWLSSQMGDPNSKTGGLVIGTIKNPLDLSTFEPYQTISVQQIRELPQYGKEFNVDFSQYPGSNKQIAFKFDTEIDESGYITNRVLIDDVHYDQTLPCYEPIDIVFSNINNNSVHINWTAKNQLPENVQIEYGLVGFTRGTGTILIANSNEISFSNLQTGSSYEFYFKSTCDSGNSIEVGPKKIETTCDILPLPWIEKFSNLRTYGENVVPDCFKLLRGTLTLENRAKEEVYNNYGPDYIRNGFDDNSYLYIKESFYTQMMTPMFNLNAGTTYKFSLKCRNSYEYRTQGVGLLVGRGQNDYNMEVNLSETGSGRLTEYNYSDLSYYFTPVVSGDYSFLMDFSNSGSPNLLADNFELKEGYTTSINGNEINTKYDFATISPAELIFEGASNSIVFDSNYENLVMNGNSTLGNWFDDKVTAKTSKKLKSDNPSVWETNQSSITKINMKVNAKNTSSLFMRFDLKQTFVASNNESMFRVVVDGNVIGTIIKPATSNADEYQTHVIDLTPYVGSDIRISLQHIGKSDLGDNAFFDNLIFNQTSTLSVAENKYTNFKYSPNPVENILNMESNSTISNVEVYSLTGQLLLKNKYSDPKVTIDFKKFPAGLYLINVIIDDKKEVFKVIKK